MLALTVLGASLLGVGIMLAFLGVTALVLERLPVGIHIYYGGLGLSVIFGWGVGLAVIIDLLR